MYMKVRTLKKVKEDGMDKFIFGENADIIYELCEKYIFTKITKRNTEKQEETPISIRKKTVAFEDEEEEEEVTPVAPLPNKAYVGSYYQDVWGTAKVYEKDGKLYFNLNKVDSPLTHKNGDVFTFFQPGSGTFDLIFTAKNKKVQSLTFDVNDPIGDFKKVK